MWLEAHYALGRVELALTNQLTPKERQQLFDELLSNSISEAEALIKYAPKTSPN